MKNRKTNFIMLILSSVLCFSTFNKAEAQTSVKIGQQEWMVNNLNVSTFKNGDAIPEASTEKEWKKAGNEGKPAWCYFKNDPKNGDKYGKLYNWYAVTDPRGLAPSGWHIPTDAEWTKLTDYLGGKETAGDKMKSKEGWKRLNENVLNYSSNESGFSALPGGFRSSGVGTYNSINVLGNWWSSSQSSFRIIDAAFRGLNFIDGVVTSGNNEKNNGYSVRCLLD